MMAPSINAAGADLRTPLPIAAPGIEGNSKNQLNTINGCYVPCLLNILGAVLYLRMGFAVGQMVTLVLVSSGSGWQAATSIDAT